MLVWVGWCRSERALRAAFAVEYSDDGDFLGSPFSRAVGIRRFNEMTTEVSRVDPSTRLSELLHEVSYAETFVPQLAASTGDLVERANAAVLFYGVEDELEVDVEGDLPDYAAHGVALRWIGRAVYTWT